MNKKNLFIYSSGRPSIENTEVEIVERKGAGHPDTLCDAIAEKISQAYSQHCLERYGVILRHMVDKIALSGGSTKVKFRGGEMKKPIELHLNCRFTRTYQQEVIPYLEIVKKVVHEHFRNILPLLDSDKWLKIVDNTYFSPGPGVVYDTNGNTKNEREFFFEVPAREFIFFHNNNLRANDTSTTVAYAPLSFTEKIVIFIENTLNGKEFKKYHPYIGNDIKVMAKRVGRDVDITVCVPFIANATPSKEFYFEKIKFLKKEIKKMVLSKFGGFNISIYLNTRDDPDKSDYYLTLTGSAIESGDEGVVGRGNRYNGVIPFTRHMSMEACCGKNPVYHVGKLYTAVCSFISRKIYDLIGVETYVYLTSQMGRSLSDPWFAGIEVCGENIDSYHRQTIEAIVEHNLANIDHVTQKIVQGETVLF